MGVVAQCCVSRCAQLALIVYYNSIIDAGCFAYFIAEPVDKKVCVGETTSFKCISSHVLSIPVWIINGTSYNWSQPPRHHEYDHKTRSLIVTNVTEFMNGTTYQCVISNDGLSAVGKLHVKPPMAATGLHMHA